MEVQIQKILSIALLRMWAIGDEWIIHLILRIRYFVITILNG